uniref:Glutathione S-transferase n=1 Tax=Panagrolaimus sp. ES5 TaxID=591445 RepID=A0AC34G332_9BILA
MEPMLIPWMLNRKRHASMELTEMPLAKKPNLNTKPQFKLISFCQRDLAETCRFIFVYAKIPYESVTFFDLKAFLKVKEAAGSMDFPQLDWNGKMIHGNDAISRMLAKMYGLAGVGIFEQAQADTIVGIVQNLSHAIIEYTKGAFGVHAIDKEKVYKETFEPGVKKYFEMLEKYASQGPEDGLFFSSGVTYADFAVANIFQLVAVLHPELLIQYKNVKAIAQRVFSLPQLKTYLASRPSIKDLMEKTRSLKQNFENAKTVCAEIPEENLKEITFYLQCNATSGETIPLNYQ